MPVHRSPGERKERTAQAAAQQWRPGGNHHIEHADAQTRLAEFVTTSKARTKIRQALKEITARQTEFAKETLERKFRNRKLGV